MEEDRAIRMGEGNDYMGERETLITMIPNPTSSPFTHHLPLPLSSVCFFLLHFLCNLDQKEKYMSDAWCPEDYRAVTLDGQMIT